MKTVANIGFPYLVRHFLILKVSKIVEHGTDAKSFYLEPNTAKGTTSLLSPFHKRSAMT